MCRSSLVVPFASAINLVLISATSQNRLQRLGVEAIVERAHFYVEGLTNSKLQPRGDVFEYNGHLYAAKQPGQFMAGALIYFALHAFGLRYLEQFLLTSALVTWFSAGLATAFASATVYVLARIAGTEHIAGLGNRGCPDVCVGDNSFSICRDRASRRDRSSISDHRVFLCVPPVARRKPTLLFYIGNAGRRAARIDSGRPVFATLHRAAHGLCFLAASANGGRCRTSSPGG